MENVKNKEKGITLIALVITIIVLIILAGVAISMLSGENGILNQATEAKEKTDDAIYLERIKLAVSEAQIGENGYIELNQENLQEALDKQFENTQVVLLYNGDDTYTVSCPDILKDYIITDNNIQEGIDWKKAMEKAKAPESQNDDRNEGVIGIGTDGNPVDMDLWEYDLMDDGTFVLNDSELNGSGYIGEISSETGEIVGKIPQYISLDGGKTFSPVTSLCGLFYKCNINIPPKIPTTVDNMNLTFSQTKISVACNIPSGVKTLSWCFEVTPIIEMPYIPEGVTDLHGTFSKCTKLTKIKKMPNSVTDMVWIFAYCTSLEEIPDEFVIPEKVSSISQSFWNCYKLKKIPENFRIPDNVDNIAQAFAFCYELEGSILMDTTPSKYVNFLQRIDMPIVINYSQNCDNITSIINQSGSSSAKKGSLVET